MRNGFYSVSRDPKSFPSVPDVATSHLFWRAMEECWAQGTMEHLPDSLIAQMADVLVQAQTLLTAHHTATALQSMQKLTPFSTQTVVAEQAEHFTSTDPPAGTALS